MPTITDMVEYDLTGMGSEIKAVLGIKSITEAQRKRIENIVWKYAKRQVKIVADHI
jgi:hypothetical protein